MLGVFLAMVQQDETSSNSFYSHLANTETDSPKHRGITAADLVPLVPDLSQAEITDALDQL